MKFALSILLACTPFAMAGTSMVAAGKGKGPATSAPAEECPNMLTYNEIQLTYVHLDADSAGTADGADVRLNVNLAQGFFAYGDASSVTGDVDNTSLDLGLGTYVPLCKAFHVVGRAGYSYFDADDADSHGWHAAVGFRTQIGCHLELNGKIQYGDLTDFSDGQYWSYGVGATYHLCERGAILVEYVFGEDDVWSIRAGIAYKF